ncbi:uncharacterized protein MYCFIDRAFT_84360 [Pseudocercospora fijiensis CIRAD86]|uniref:BTB domain-containing protein n=1 Tax=Pseudocercospora fijiensis (strain CIRAD86) TaxID=383855 RepID=M3AK90_PSEFD|nr:uncharacterized protein MYCFIDRAFT_84360 [Pseudocercospora fijiensis CIRAD86]EME77583.1 hypothetical protein MYCFIDRAFT_84360 [Pseudocercospora fijiensis CIRAD86]
MAGAASRDVRYADMLVVCGNCTWEVHSNFVCPRAAVFENAFERSNPNMVVDLTGEKEQVVAAVIEYIYDGHYGSAEPASDDDISLHADVLRLANQHRMEDLHALDRLYTNMREEDIMLRIAATAIAVTHARELLGDPARYARFNRVVARHAPLAATLAQSLAHALNESQNGSNFASQDTRTPSPP